MKKAYLCLFYLFALIASPAIASSPSPALNECPPTDGKPVLCSETELIAGPDQIMGIVSVYIADNTLTVKYEAKGNYTLNATNLFVGDVSDLPTNLNGSPNIEAFPHGANHAKGTTIVSYDIDISNLKFKKIAIAAYSILKGITYETAWVGNIALSDSAGATYYEFDLDACAIE
ncbi:hypothetical protein POV27_07920 [Aureisphaera galaxeae]|uniref:hypothetical protein n=1 Tax=Aureisphaera galaxeae TaxID=1538023 RepID=UPI00234FF106|nr:hypothetical protein [Aureisphaera galaxeae]MDC8003976.1 hypothetical protein [Aureisphaera galaxeae]